MRLVLTIACIAIHLSSWGQLHFALEDLEVSFPPTTKDSTSVESVIIFNSLSVPQLVTLEGIEAPFYIDETVFAIPANDTTTIDITFTPTSVNLFEDSLYMSGNVFGGDAISISGEGTLPEISLVNDSIHFDDISINSIHETTFMVTNTGVGTLFISEIDSSNEYFTCDETDIQITEGDTVEISVQFYSELADFYSTILTLYSSDPLHPLVEMYVDANAISQIEGTVCGNLSIINSPYVFIDNVVVPEECSLSIDPGVTVDLNGFQLNVLGTLECIGTNEERITIENGEIELSQDQFVTEYTDFSNNASADIVNRQNKYLETFESGFQPFYCYSQGSGWNGTSGDGNYQCDDFYNISSDEWASNGTRCLRFYSYYYDGHLQLDEAVSELEPGLYQWSTLFKSQELARGTSLIISYQVNDGSWVEFYRSPPDGYEIQNEQFAAFSDFFVITDENSTANIRFQHDVQSGSCYDEVVTYLDDIRLDKVDVEPYKTEIYNNQSTLGGSSTSNSTNVMISGASNAYGGVGNCLKIQTGQGQPVGEWITRPFTAHSSKVFVEYQEKVTTSDPNCWYYTYYQVNENDWQLLRDHRDQNQCGNGSIENYDWHNIHYIIEDLLLGDQLKLKFRVEAYDIGNPAYRDVTLLIDEFNIYEDYKQPVCFVSNNTTNVSINQCTISGEMNLQSPEIQIHIQDSDVADVFIEGVNATAIIQNTNIKSLSMPYNSPVLSLENSDFTNDTGKGLYTGNMSDVSIYNCSFSECGNSGITAGNQSSLDIRYSYIMHNGGDGLELGLDSELELRNSLVSNNLGYGINSAGSISTDYSVLSYNHNQAAITQNFSTIDNSIIWFNDGVPQLGTGNVFAISYSNIQGINALLTSSSFAWGDGCVGTDPVFQDDLAYLDPFSPCVDGGKPWEQDAHIPYGLGSTRSDMGLYGGPDNAFWGGEAPPNGAVSITDAFDIPEDEGGFVGIHFSASPFDFGGLGFTVTHYSIWRDLALGADNATSIDLGNWEQIGTVPAQGFAQYGFTAETLIDQMPEESACLSNFLVIAHTTDDNIYWISEVASVCSIDNLAPEIPDIEGIIEQDDDGEVAVVISWEEVEAEDYVYTEVFNLETGFYALVQDDTLTVDDSAIAGIEYTYGAVNVDIHGNISDTAYVTLSIDPGEDIIPLYAGWNLISLDRHPESTSITSVLSSLESGNAEYVTGYDDGALFYDANGLEFLNTLVEMEGGIGYWVKVLYDDTLEVPGDIVASGYFSEIVNGWNLIGYPGSSSIEVENYFSDGIESEELQYVTGFYETGTVVYNPNGLPFLNTLTELKNSKGYWLKWDALNTEEVIVNDEDKFVGNPSYMFINGNSNLNVDVIEIVNELNQVVGRLDVNEEGWIMTGVLYGDDLLTSESEGCLEGETLSFRSNGIIANEHIQFYGDMRHELLQLTFPNLNNQFDVLPNPANSSLEFVCSSSMEHGNMSWFIYDNKGLLVDVITRDEYLGGITQVKYSCDHLAPGTYHIEFRLNNKLIGQRKLLIAR